MMQCFYINLDKAVERRQRLEANFNQTKVDGFTLTRFSACDLDWVKNHQPAGRITEREKACYASHLSIIKQNLGAAEPYCIFEDDTQFGSSTFKNIQKVLGKIGNNDWDIIFLDVILTSIPQIARICDYARKYRFNRDFTLIDLRPIYYCAASAYLVNGRNAQKVIDLLDNSAGWDEAIDTTYFMRTRDEKLNCFLTVPFLTTVNELSLNSDIQQDQSYTKDFIFNSFRIACWMEQDEAITSQRFADLQHVLVGARLPSKPE